MDAEPGIKDFKRKTRNLSEKKRRDQFNILISELSTMVSANSRKMDKSTVLKSAISHLKSHSEIITKSRMHEIESNWKPSFLANDEFAHLILEAIDGFIIVFSISGQIFYVSENVTSLLGQLTDDIANGSFYKMVYEADRNILFNMLSSFHLTENRVSFCCRMQRGQLESDNPVSYEIIKFLGFIKTNCDYISDVAQKAEHPDTTMKMNARIAFVGVGQLETPQLTKQIRLPIDNQCAEFSSRYSLEWKFLSLDHRAASIIGYLPFELLGMSGYDYYHIEDLDEVVNCHKSLMQRGEGTSCNYRFLTKGQQWIWLQTRFYITYHQWNSKPEFVVCTHRVIRYHSTQTE